MIIKRKCIFNFLLFLFMHSAANAQQRIEGLSYLDKKPVSVMIKDGKIIEVKKITRLSEKNKNLFIAPGLIDNQVNGFEGISFTSELTEADVYKVTHALWERGVTTYFPTLITNTHDLLLKNFSILSHAKKNPSMLGSIAGFHLEGPYISPEDGYRGTHALRFVRPPDWNEFMEFYKASGNNIITITVAPELPGALEFIKNCTAQGIVVAIGHHNASTKIIEEAVSNGARTCTHLGNGMSNTINRHVNPLWPQLSNDKLMISIICDGFHLRPEEIRVFFKVKGAAKTIITSDVTEYAGLKPGVYISHDGDSLELTPDGEVRNLQQKVLYGAASAVNKGVGHIIEVTGCSLADAIQMSSSNPAKLYGLTDRGSLQVGKRADLIVFKLVDNQLKIQKTIVAGKEVYSNE
jgi:N-acetylglucosamine-6-phosphate deacetylase